jgi:chromosome segregation ATPase
MKDQKSEWRKRYKTQKAQLKKAENEINRLEKVVKDIEILKERQTEEFNQQLKTKSQEMKLLRKSHHRELSRIQSEIRNTELQRNRKPKLYFYHHPEILIHPIGSMNSVFVDKFRKKVKLYRIEIRDFQQRNESLISDKQQLIQNIGDLEREIDLLNTKLISSETQTSEANKQLNFLRSRIDNSTSKKKVGKLKRVDRHYDSNQEIISNQRQEIENLNVALQSAQNRISSQFAEIEKLTNDIELKSNEPIVLNSNDRSECSDSISYFDCVSDLPNSIEPEIKRLLNTPGMRNSSKMKCFARILNRFYEQQIETIRNELTNKIVEFTSIFSDFIPSCSLLVLKKQISLDDFLIDPTLKSKFVSALRSICNTSTSIHEMEKRMESIEKENHSLTSKLKKCKERLQSQNVSDELIRYSKEIENQQNRIEELENSNRQLTIERNHLQQMVESQRKEFLDKLHAAKTYSLHSYEDIITQLKQKCNDQRETIRKLSHQIGASV